MLKKMRFFLKKHLLGNISQKAHFLNTILFHNIKPHSITRSYTAFQKILLIGIFFITHFRSKKCVFYEGQVKGLQQSI